MKQRKFPSDDAIRMCQACRTRVMCETRARNYIHNYVGGCARTRLLCLICSTRTMLPSARTVNDFPWRRTRYHIGTWYTGVGGKLCPARLGVAVFFFRHLVRYTSGASVLERLHRKFATSCWQILSRAVVKIGF